MSIVEPSQALSIESFSYSWLINLKPSLESISDSFRAALDSSDESSFIDMDPKLPPSKRFNKLIIDFDLPYSEPLTDTSNASLFSDGPKRKACLTRCRSLLSRKMFEKYLYFLSPLLERIRCCRLSKSKLARTYSPLASSPRTSVGSADYWRRSCDSESSIHEAVLHCKRSIGM